MNNVTLKDLFQRFWQHVVAALGAKANTEDLNNLKTKIEGYENNITFEITYDDGTTKTIKVLGAEVNG